MGFLTTPDFWDCECSEKFIHSRQVERCAHCGAHRDEQPDSRLFEVDEDNLGEETIKYMRRRVYEHIDLIPGNALIDICYPRLTDESQYHADEEHKPLSNA